MSDSNEKQQRPRLFLTQLREKENQHGAYFIGNFQACDMIVQRAKSDGVWNVFLVQADLEKKQQRQGGAGPGTGGGTNAGFGEVPY